MDTKKLRQKILDLAIHGKLVPQDPNDEPASVLLQRIRTEKERLIKEGKIKRSRKPAKTSDTPHYEQKPFELPQGWVWTTLGVVGEWQSGGTPSRSNKSYYGGNIPWLKTGDLNDGFILNIPESITEEAVANSSAKINPTGSVLIAMYGATIGKLGILTFPSATNQACCACIEFRAITQLYLFYFLLSQRSRFISRGGGGAQSNISKELIVNTHIPLPPLSEQQRIVIEIEKYFVLIDDIEQGKADLQTAIKQAKSKILELAISGKLVPQNPADEPASELLKRINPKAEIACDNEHYPQLPKGWCTTSLKRLQIEVLNGYAFQSCNYTEEGVRIIRIANVQDGQIVDDSPKFYPIDSISEIHKYQLRAEDLLMSLTGNVGRVGFLPQIMLPAALNQRVCCIRTTEEIIYKKYLYIFFQSNLFRTACESSAKGVAQLNVSTEWLKNFLIALPPLAEQKRIVEKIEQLFCLLEQIEESL